jgi:hypothetical protein
VTRPQQTAFYFSDETGAHTGGRYFLVGGVALISHRLWTRDQLLQIERVSGKDKKDWHATKNPLQRRRYIEEVLKIEALRGAVFHAEYRDNGKNYFDCTVDALVSAIATYGEDRHNIVVHQGFAFAARTRLARALERQGHSYEIQPGNQNKRVEIRLADALCGYVGMMSDPDNVYANAFPELPEWFVDLKKRSPPSP